MSGKFEGLSALMDAETGELETRRVLEETRKDPELGQAWRRYHLASALIKQHKIESKIDISGDVMSRIYDEDRVSSRSKNVQQSAPIWQGFASMAVAASVTLAVFLGFQQVSVQDAQLTAPVQAGVIERTTLRTDLLPTALGTATDTVTNPESVSSIGLVPLSKELGGLIAMHRSLEPSSSVPLDWALSDKPAGWRLIGTVDTVEGGVAVYEDNQQKRISVLVTDSGVQGPQGAVYQTGTLAYAVNAQNRFISVIGAESLSEARQITQSIEFPAPSE